MTYSIGNDEGNRKKGNNRIKIHKRKKNCTIGIIRFGTVNRIDLRCMPETEIPRNGENTLGERVLKICTLIVEL